MSVLAKAPDEVSDTQSRMESRVFVSLSRSLKL